jgi:predicted DNA-binding protein YlxM (UPF0122 family)
MSVKFQIGFTITSETLFAMMSKFLPIEDLSVQEILEQPKIKQSAIAKLIEENRPKMISDKKKRMARFKHESGRTLQSLVEEAMAKNPDKLYGWGELSEFAYSFGFHKSSINNAITRMILQKVIEKAKPGMYKLSGKKYQKSA